MVAAFFLEEGGDLAPDCFRGGIGACCNRLGLLVTRCFDGKEFVCFFFGDGEVAGDSTLTPGRDARPDLFPSPDRLGGKSLILCVCFFLMFLFLFFYVSFSNSK